MRRRFSGMGSTSDASRWNGQVEKVEDGGGSRRPWLYNGVPHSTECMVRHPLVLLGLTAVACSPQKREESGQLTDSAVVVPDPGTADVWGAVYDGSDPSVPFLPDAHARYWRYAFERPPTGTALLLDGALSDVRYQAVDVYDDDTRTSLGAVRDTALNGMLRLWVADPEDLANLDERPSCFWHMRR